MGLLQLLEDKIIQLLQPILRPIQPLITIFTSLKENTIGIFTAGTELTDSIKALLDSIEHFQEKPHVKSRVISLPRIVTNIQELVALPGQVVDAFKDLWNTLKNKIDPETAFDVEELEGLEDLRAIVTKFGSAIAEGFEKFLGIFALIVDSLVAIRSSITDIQTLVDAAQTVVDDLTNLDLVFLPQNNPRKTLALEDGGTIRIRVGNLH